jgi:hypothetical protein
VALKIAVGLDLPNSDISSVKLKIAALSANA